MKRRKVDKFSVFSLLIMLLLMFALIKEERENCKKLGMNYSYDYGCIKGEK